MAARRKLYYPWELWSKEIKAKDMLPLMVKYSRVEPNHVCRAVVSAPFLRTEVVNGVAHKIIDRDDIFINSFGQATNRNGKRVEMFDLNLAAYGES